MEDNKGTCNTKVFFKNVLRTFEAEFPKTINLRMPKEEGGGGGDGTPSHWFFDLRFAALTQSK